MAYSLAVSTNKCKQEISRLQPDVCRVHGNVPGPALCKPNFYELRGHEGI